MSRALEVLRDTFGYTEFRRDQAAIIEHIIQGGHALVLMSTGAGKSLCYQIPALLRPGVTIVVSPLVSLMQNQVSILTELGISAACLNAATDLPKTRAIFDAIQKHQLNLLYVAPERLLSPNFLKFIDKINVGLFAIDEAHCVSQWGNYFRPEYQQLNVLKKRYPHVPRLALTATADQQTCHDILHYLDLSDAKQFISSFDRPNLFYQVIAKHNAKKQLLDFIRSEFIGASGIVYCLSRKRVEAITHWLCEQGIRAIPYHAGLDHSIRENNQYQFLHQDNVVMVATVAFGMGIDKPDIRFVAHIDMPKSLENFYQESGRAGRDEMPATSWLCYGLNDFVQLKARIMQSSMSNELKRIELKRLNEVLAFCENTACRCQYLLRYFNEESKLCGHCDNCLNPPKTYDASLMSQKLMSCIYRAKQSFSAQHIIDILQGKATALVKFNQHDQLSTYGIGRDTSEKEWRALIRQLISQDFLDVDVEAYLALRLTQKSRTVLKGQSFIVAKSIVKMNRIKHDRLWLRSERQERIWQALREWRLRIATKHQVPTYGILSDRTLRELVEIKPVNAEALGKIYGIGKTKQHHYGKELLGILHSI
jgi:ATP-dependent DNA helicase RecQ